MSVTQKTESEASAQTKDNSINKKVIRKGANKEHYELKQHWDLAFLKLLGITTVFRLAFAFIAGLKYEEAYYWNYGQHDALSFFDHPPLIGWLIRFFTQIGSNSEIWVRMPAILCFTGTLALIYLLTKELFGSKTGFMASLMACCLPAFEWYSQLALPDAPLLFFWTCGLYFGYKLVHTEQRIWWIAVGACTGLGLVSKYPAAFIPLAPALALACNKRWKLLFCTEMVAGFILACMLFSPVFIWNAEHQWASFLFQGTGRFEEAGSFLDRLSSILTQNLLLSPGGFFLMLWVFFTSLKQYKKPAYQYLLCATVPFALVLTAVMCVRLVQMNWPLPLYIGLIIMAAARLEEVEAWTTKRLLMGLIFVPAILLSLVPLVVTAAPGIGALNSADDFSNWKPLAKTMLEVRQSMPDQQKTFQAGHGYQLASEIAYYTNMPQYTLSNNVLGEHAKSYDYWQKPQELIGWDCLYATYEEVKYSHSKESSGDGSASASVIEWRQRVKFDPALLAACFTKIEKADRITTYKGGKPLRRYQIYKCYGYLGPQGLNKAAAEQEKQKAQAARQGQFPASKTPTSSSRKASRSLPPIEIKLDSHR